MERETRETGRELVRGSGEKVEQRRMEGGKGPDGERGWQGGVQMEGREERERVGGGDAKEGGGQVFFWLGWEKGK